MLLDLNSINRRLCGMLIVSIIYNVSPVLAIFHPPLAKCISQLLLLSVCNVHVSTAAHIRYVFNQCAFNLKWGYFKVHYSLHAIYDLMHIEIDEKLFHFDELMSMQQY